MANPVKWTIIEKLAGMLEEITTARGYRNQVREVNKEEVSPENMEEFPCINVLVQPENYLNPIESEAGRLVKTLNVTLDCYLEGEEDKQKRTISLEADVEKRLFDDQDTDPPNGIFAYNLEGTCNIIIPVNSTPFNVESTRHLFGFEFNVQIHYRQSRNDPTVLYN